MAPITPGPSDGSPPAVAVRRRRMLGVGLRADLVDARDLARDLSLRRTARGVDLDVVEGVDALTQALAIGLTTLRGSDPFNVTFGFPGLDPLTDATPAPFAHEALRGAAAALVAADPRVRRVVDVAASTPAGTRSLDLTVTFEAVSGESTQLSLGALTPGAGGPATQGA